MTALSLTLCGAADKALELYESHAMDVLPALLDLAERALGEWSLCDECGEQLPAPSHPANPEEVG